MDLNYFNGTLEELQAWCDVDIAEPPVPLDEIFVKTVDIDGVLVPAKLNVLVSVNKKLFNCFLQKQTVV